MRLFGEWYLVKDTGIPRSYPPRAQAELVANRLEKADSHMNDIAANTVIEDLFRMVQEGKYLLLHWKRSGELSDSERRELSRRTKHHLERSSSERVKWLREERKKRIEKLRHTS